VAGLAKKKFFFENPWARGVRALAESIILLGACRNSILGVFGIFLAKKSVQISKFSEGIFFTFNIYLVYEATYLQGMYLPE